MIRARFAAFALGSILGVGALITLATPVSADNALTTTGLGAEVLNEDVLNHGRLPPQTAELHIEYAFQVTVPLASVCPIQSVSVSYEYEVKADWKDQTVATLSKNRDSFQTSVANSSEAKTYGPFKVVLTIKTGRGVPAFESGEYAVIARASSPGGDSQCFLTDSGPARIPYTVTNDYYPLMEFSPIKYLLKTGPNSEAQFLIRAQNYGNAQTRVTMDIVDLSGGKLPAIIPPAPVTVESKASGAEKNTRDIPIAVRTPSSQGYSNTLYSFEVRFNSTAITPAIGVAREPQRITFTVQMQGVYVPGFDPVAGLVSVGAALGLVAAARRRP